jgi:hypothetical protein
MHRCECGWRMPLVSVSAQAEGFEDQVRAAKLQVIIACPGCSAIYATDLELVGDRTGEEIVEDLAASASALRSEQGP